VVTIAALIGDRAVRARFRETYGGAGGVSFYDTAAQLAAAVADGTASIVVAEWRDTTGATIEAAIRDLHTDYPTVPILLYAPLTPRGARDMLAGTRAGATDVVIANHDDIGLALRNRIASAQTVALADHTVSRLSTLVPELVARMLGFFFRHAQSAPTVGATAVALRVHRKTLALHCARAGLPTPSALCCWARLILAAQRLEDPARTTEQAATELGFPSGHAFRNMLRRYTGLSASDVRERGGSAHLVQLLTAQLAEAAGRTRSQAADDRSSTARTLETR
jgi:AraC-like DNA-binding protein